jgi:Fe-S cluster biogenesis protein NfuA
MTHESVWKDSVKASLEKMQAMLRNDGYELEVDVNDSRVTLTVVPGPGACSECLVPKDTFVAIAATMMQTNDITVPVENIQAVYPVDSPT